MTNPNPTNTSENAGHARQILRQVDRYWRGSGIPRAEREDRLAELRTHLDDAVAEGRDVNKVVGPDVVAFASRWIQADRSLPWLDITVRFFGGLTLSAGLLALLGPVALDLNNFAITSEGLLFVLVIWLYRLAADIVRRYRSRLSSTTVFVLAVVGIIAAGVTGGLLTSTLGGAFSIDLPLAIVILLLTLGAACAAASWKLRRTARTARPT